MVVAGVEGWDSKTEEGRGETSIPESSAEDEVVDVSEARAGALRSCKGFGTAVTLAVARVFCGGVVEIVV